MNTETKLAIANFVVALTGLLIVFGMMIYHCDQHINPWQ